MSTRPLGAPPVIPDDPGPWSGILEVLQRRGTLPGRRRAEPPNGLMISPPPRTSLVLEGAVEGATVAGTGPVRVAAAAREGALTLERTPEGLLAGVNKMVSRRWDADTLGVVDEQRPDADPASSVPDPVWIDDLADGDLPDEASLSPDGSYAVVSVVEPPRYRGVAVIRVSDRAVLRYIRFARCGVWNADGSRLVVGGEWGLLALDNHVPAEESTQDGEDAGN